MILDTKIHDVEVGYNCLMLSEDVEKDFSGKLWSCTSCKHANGVMMGNTTKRKWKASHKKSSCSLHLENLLPPSKKYWGKTIDNGDPNYVYGKPKEFKDLQKKKIQPSSSSSSSSAPPVDSSKIVSVLESVVR